MTYTDFDLIVPDVHEKVDTVQNLLERYPDTRNNVFLGDYFDSFEWANSPKQWELTCELLVELSKNPKNILLVGNHDVHYFTDRIEYKCSGFNPAKYRMINDILGKNWLTKNCQWCYTVQHAGRMTVLSHAGFAGKFLPPKKTPITEDFFTDVNIEISRNYSTGTYEPRLRAGWGGGGYGTGGINWVDWNKEFEICPRIRQIVGHTPGRTPRYKDDNLCLDTHLNHVALMNINTGEIIIEKV